MVLGYSIFGRLKKIMTKDEQWMLIAIKEAELAMEENEVPVGCVLVQNGKILAQAHNQPIKNIDPTAHAEIQVLRKAARKTGNYRLVGTTLYVTLEPCAMCFGAIVHARIDKVVFGSADPKSGVCGSCINLNDKEFLNHKILISSGVLEDKCRELLVNFFKAKRQHK